jgi:mono/diheme cytochrome c family protein
MKKIYVVSMLAIVSLTLAYCSASKKAARIPKSTFAANLSTVISANCAPCHIPALGGNKKAYDNYANVQTDIDEMIRRIELNPTDRGFMPFKKAEKLPVEIVDAFKKWKADGMLEK